MIWILFVILLIVVIVAVSRSGKKSKMETEKLQVEVKKMDKPDTVLGVSDELSKLKKLLDEGVITQDEFDIQKKRLLNT